MNPRKLRTTGHKRAATADITFTRTELKLIWRGLRCVENSSDRRATFWRDHLVLGELKTPLQRANARRRFEQEDRLFRASKELANKIEQRMRWMP